MIRGYHPLDNDAVTNRFKLTANEVKLDVDTFRQPEIQRTLLQEIAHKQYELDVAEAYRVMLVEEMKMNQELMDEIEELKRDKSRDTETEGTESDT
jgi:hypothetical protein